MQSIPMQLNKQEEPIIQIAPETAEPDILIWNEDDLPKGNYTALGARLAERGDLFRAPRYGGGLVLALSDGKHEEIRKGADLFPLIVDRIPVEVIKGGKSIGGRLPAAHLGAMLRCEAFLSQFLPVDLISVAPLYLPDINMTALGYNDGGEGQRVLYLGGEPAFSDSMDTINAFLDVMAFDSNADRTNTVASALTVLLRNFWPGGKPIIVTTATKSHAGKDTIISFAAGLEQLTSISYQSTDWALERSFVGAIKHSPETAVMVIENARLNYRDQSIASAYVERFATDPFPLLNSTGTGEAVRIRNSIVLAISTNYGSVSEDILNRSLPIHLAPVGSVADRESPIGNPKHEFLPQHREQIAAEMRGMIERWKTAGMPLDEDVKHPFSPWAKTIGGILKVNGFENFLDNYGVRKSADDPIRKGLGLLGAASPDRWLTATDWARLVVEEGLTKAIISPIEQGSDAGRIRSIGVVLSNHRDETLIVETDSSLLSLRLEKHRGRFGNPQPQVRYRFKQLAEEPLQEDAPEMVEVRRLRPKPK